jgi:SNF2 family DNA or RNA helicase
MAEAGLLDEIDDPDATQGDTLKAITACLQAVNSPQLLLDGDGNPFEGKSSKLESLIDLLEGDAEGKKVIIYSKFEKMVSLMGERLEKEKIKYTRITGKESDPKIREKNKNLFQDPKSDVNVIMITNAGAESVNLQAAENFIFFDLPWSYGDYLQLVGRMIRIGSKHETVTAHHFLGRKIDGKKTIDHHILKALKSKKKLADKVAGENLQGAFEFKDGDATMDAINLIREESGGKKMTKRLPSKTTTVKEEVKYVPIIDLSDLT